MNKHLNLRVPGEAVLMAERTATSMFYRDIFVLRYHVTKEVQLQLRAVISSPHMVLPAQSGSALSFFPVGSSRPHPAAALSSTPPIPDYGTSWPARSPATDLLLAILPDQQKDCLSLGEGWTSDSASSHQSHLAKLSSLEPIIQDTK